MTGTSVFEGIRGYWSDADKELYLFRIKEHLRRLEQSAKIVRIPLKFASADLTTACVAVARANEFREDIHFLVTVYLGLSDDLIMMSPTDETIVSVTAIPRGGKSIGERGISCEISSWRRISEADMPPRVKAGANYYHGRFARLEAAVNGVDNSIFLDGNGNVTEANGAAVMIVRDGVVFTPPVTDGILESITRQTIFELAAEQEIAVVERHIGRTELYISDEVFVCGTGSELTAVASVDGIEIGDGKAGPITRHLQTHYRDVVRGVDSSRRDWLTPVYADPFVQLQHGRREAGPA